MKAKKSDFQFSNPRIKKTLFCVNEQFDSEKYKGLDVAYNVERIHQTATDAELDLIIQVGGETEAYPFFIEITMSAMFKWDNCGPEMDVDMLLSQNAVALLISYVRPHIAYLTSSAGFNAYHLPYLSIINEQK